MHRARLLLLLPAALALLDDGESLLQVHTEPGLPNEELDEIATSIGHLLSHTVEVSQRIYEGVAEDFASVGVDLRALGGSPEASLLETSARVSGDEENSESQDSDAEKKDAFVKEVQNNVTALVSQGVVMDLLPAGSASEDQRQATAEVHPNEDEGESAEGELRELREQESERATEEDAEDERAEDAMPTAMQSEPLNDAPSNQMQEAPLASSLYEVPNDPLYSSDPLLANPQLELAPLAPLEPQFPPVYESQFKVADERPLRPGETFRPAVIPLNPAPAIEETPLLRSEEPLQQSTVDGAPVEFYKGPAYVAEEYVPPPPAPVEAIEPVDVQPLDMQLPETMPESQAVELAQHEAPAEPAEPEVEPEKPMGYYEEDLIKTSNLVGLRAVPVKDEMYMKPYTLPEMPKLRPAEGDESSEVKSIDDRWLRQARARLTAVASKAAVKTAGLVAGTAMKKQLEQRLNPFLMGVDKYIEGKIENATRRINLDVNLRTLRTSQALSDAAVAVWANLTGADNGKARENALYRLIDELRLENQPPSAKFRLLYGIDRALRGHAHHLGDATYSLFSRLTEDQIEKRLAERKELLGQKTISAANVHDSGSNPLWRGSRAGKPAPEYDVHKLVGQLESMQKPTKL